MTQTFELLAGILASDFCKHFFATRMLPKKTSYIINFAVDDDPTVPFAVVLRNFLNAIRP